MRTNKTNLAPTIVFIATGGKNTRLLRPYKVKFVVRHFDELVCKDDYLCIGDPSSVYDWTKIHPESIMIGRPANAFTLLPIGRKEDYHGK
jgi:hypothetical protein